MELFVIHIEQNIKIINVLLWHHSLGTSALIIIRMANYSTIVLSSLGHLSVSVMCTLFSFFPHKLFILQLIIYLLLLLLLLLILIISIYIRNSSITIIIYGILTARIIFCNHWAPMASKSLGRTAQTNAQDITRNMLMKPWRLTFSALIRKRQ